MNQIDLIDPIAWVGEDRLVVKDCTRYGLNRRVIARKGDLPNVYDWLMHCNQEANDMQVYHWMVEVESYYVLWIVWKDKP